MVLERDVEVAGMMTDVTSPHGKNRKGNQTRLEEGGAHPRCTEERHDCQLRSSSRRRATTPPEGVKS